MLFPARIYCRAYRSRFIPRGTRRCVHAGEKRKNRLSLYEGALNSINVGLPVNVSFYPLLAMQPSARGNAVGSFAAGWARYLSGHLLLYFIYIPVYLFIYVRASSENLITLSMKQNARMISLYGYSNRTSFQPFPSTTECWIHKSLIFFFI